jgi:hypothetical protein
MVVIDHASRKVYGSWQYDRWNGGSPVGSWNGVLSLDGEGNGDTSTGAGVSRAAGVIRANEIAAGEINHALVFSTNLGNCAAAFRSPATQTDGRSPDPTASRRAPGYSWTRRSIPTRYRA